MDDDAFVFSNAIGPELPVPTIADILAAVESIRRIPPPVPVTFDPYLGDFFGVVQMPRFMGWSHSNWSAFFAFDRPPRPPFEPHVFCGPDGFALFACTHLADAYRPEGVP